MAYENYEAAELDEAGKMDSAAVMIGCGESVVPEYCTTVLFSLPKLTFSYPDFYRIVTTSFLPRAKISLHCSGVKAKPLRRRPRLAGFGHGVLWAACG